jgi:DNA-binding winged helix-turn-helix (wHTH) protein
VSGVFDMNRDVHTVYRFGEFELDPNESSLRRDGREIPLQPQVFNCLLVLVRHAGQLVTKQDLFGPCGNEASDFCLRWLKKQ